MENEENFNLLPDEEKRALITKRSHRRLFFAFLIIDIGLFAYLIYALIMLFMNL
ncbi:MAG: hypothetical protein MJ207_00325 [Bacilli bacterium]|nr:hypothetical protein [Bacilli bacterium]